MHKILLNIISALHIMLLLFVMCVPFINSNYLLLLHFIIVPFIIFHWIINDNTCFLTVVERGLKKKIYGYVDEESCLTCKLVEPVYDFKKNYVSFTVSIYAITISFWLITAGRLYYKYHSGEISNWKQLFMA